MSLLSPTVHRTILFVDVADFTNPARTVADLSAVQEGVYQVIETAFRESGLDYDSCETEDRGDGALIMVPPEVSKSVLADRLPDRLVAELRRYNATRMPAARFKLRIGIHAGDIRRNAKSWVGVAVNTTARILEATEVKSALAQSDGLLALVASNYFFTEVIEPDPGMVPERYRRIEAQVKTFAEPIWLRLPGEGVPMPVLPAAEPPRQAALTRDPVEPTDDVLGVMPDSDVRTLRGWLSDQQVPHLSTLVARAVGPAIPPPRQTSAWEVFRYLSDFNAGPDGVPPALAFLTMLAAEVGGDFETWVSGWVDSQVRRMRLAPAVAELRAGWQPIPDLPHLHLMLVVEPDRIDQDRCVLSFWRQDDPLVWPPTRGGVRELARDELEFGVDEIILDAEQAWAGQPVAVVIEFVLARSMLTLPVFHWCKEHHSGDPRPLAFDYRLGVRSLERMRTKYWHRQWKVRWESAGVHPIMDRIHPFGPTTKGIRIDAELSDPRWIGLVMDQPPAPQPERGRADVLTAALRAGLPFICWHPTATPEDLRKQVDWLVGGEGGLVDLPERHKQALRSGPSDNSNDLLHDLVVMWEDPNRLIDFEQPSIRTP